jgi:hypothetical protein
MLLDGLSNGQALGEFVNLLQRICTFKLSVFSRVSFCCPHALRVYGHAVLGLCLHAECDSMLAVVIFVLDVPPCASVLEKCSFA